MIISTYQNKEGKDEPKKKFIPKTRAPHLMQQEAIDNKKKPTITTQLKPIYKPTKAVVAQENKKTTKKEKEKVSVKTNALISDEKTNELINVHEEVSKLYGIQRKITHFFVKRCIEKNGVETGAITSETLREIAQVSMNTSHKTIKKVLQRMIDKNIFIRTPGKSKRGRGGFSNFTLSKSLIDVVRLQIELEQNHLSLMPNKEITEGTNEKLPEEWASIDYTKIEHIGFGVGQINQIYNKKINTPSMVQESINQFSYTLENKPTILEKYKSPIAALMSTLNKGGAWFETDYISPKEIATKELLNQKKKEKERLDEIEKEIMEIDFNKWIKKQDKQWLDDLIPANMKNRESFRQAILRNYFRENIYST